MKVYILHTTIRESGSFTIIYKNTQIFSSRELAQEYIDLSPTWSRMYNEGIDYHIQDTSIIEDFDREYIAAETKAENELMNQEYDNAQADICEEDSDSQFNNPDEYDRELDNYQW